MLRRFLTRGFTMGALAAAIASPAGADIRWQSGGVTAVRQTPAQAADALLAISKSAARHAVVQFNGPITPAQRRDLAAAGVELQAYVGGNAYFAHLPGVIDRERVAQLQALSAGLAVQADWKLHPHLIAGKIVPWSIVEGKDPQNPIVGAYVLFHADTPAASEGARIVRQFGGTVRTALKTVNALVIEAPYQNLKPLAASDGVQWVEPPLPKFDEINDSNRERVGAGAAQDPPYGLTGAGVDVLVYDGGTVGAHTDFDTRVTVGPTDTSGESFHATHVAGTVAGSGAESGGLFKGMAPGANIISYGFEQEGGLQAGFLYTDPGDLEADYGAAINTFGADISNNSIGSNVESNGFDCTWQGDYGLCSTVIDSVVRGSLSGGEPFRIVWANGNERQGTRCDIEGFGQYYSIAPPAGAKNHITVGALNSNDDSVTDFTSWGPTEDGRMKPDISGPGCQSDADFGVTSCGIGGGYIALCGTSMSSPTVCGLSALLLEDYRVHFPGQPDFRNSTLKTLWAHTARDIQNPGPDYQTGYGSVRVVPAIDFMRSGNFVEDEVDGGDSTSVVVIVGAADSTLKITLAWDDEPSAPNALGALVNDLDLVVTSPSGVRHYPWTLDPANPGLPAVQSAENHLDNIEQVFVDSPETGGWTVEVRGTNVPSGSQIYSLAASPLLINCSSAGFVRLDRSKYNCDGGVATVRVVDCDLNTDDETIQTVNVLVKSTSEPAGETILLTESSPEAAAFLGSISLSTLGGPGVLTIAAGDTIRAEYIDADDGEGGMNVLTAADSSVDCTAPVITSVTVSDIRPSAATITITTDEPASGRIRYGTACGELKDAALRAQFATTHQFRISGLVDVTTYYFAVDSTDEAGNSTTDDNGGACHSFTTPVLPVFFTEQFTSENDLPGRFVIFTPTKSSDFYSACDGALFGNLPVNPAGGTVLAPSDDAPEQVTLSDGARVSLYEESYPSFYVSPNGYLTFTGPDFTYNESFAAHFSQPRVAGWFDDLNANDGGQVSWKQLPDRVAVTWENISEFFGANQNTFQIVMYFDGRIQIAWGAMDAIDGISGLSSGNGVDPDFVASDFALFAPCGPQPPFADDVAVEVGVGLRTTIALVGADDGLPDPPAALSYVIESLPATGTLKDPQGGLITSVPHTLANFGSTVEYAGPTGFGGIDEFTYHVDDGGTAPDGGASNTGGVEIVVGGIEPIYGFLLDDQDAGFLTPGQWDFGQPTGGGSFSFDPTSGYTGNNVYGFNLLGDYPNGMTTPRHLTSVSMDMTGVIRSTLSFRRWLGIESAVFDHAYIQASNDGANWNDVWVHGNTTIDDASWTLQTYDISAFADDQPDVKVRWGIGPTDSSVTLCGWNLDDIVVLGIRASAPCPGDLNDDGIVSIEDLAQVLSNYAITEGAHPNQGDMDGDGDIDIADLAFILSAFADVCP